MPSMHAAGGERLARVSADDLHESVECVGDGGSIAPGGDLPRMIAA